MNLKKFLESKSDLLTISIDVEGYADDVNLYQHLYFESDDILEHIESQAGLLSFYSVLFRVAEMEFAKLEREYDRWFTLKYEVEFSRLRREDEGRKPNISSVENAVKSRCWKEYDKLKSELERAQLQVSLLKDAVKWFDEKGRMLVQAAKLWDFEAKAADFYGFLKDDKPDYSKYEKIRK